MEVLSDTYLAPARVRACAMVVGTRTNLVLSLTAMSLTVSPLCSKLEGAGCGNRKGIQQPHPGAKLGQGLRSCHRSERLHCSAACACT